MNLLVHSTSVPRAERCNPMIKSIPNAQGLLGPRPRRAALIGGSGSPGSRHADHGVLFEVAGAGLEGSASAGWSMSRVTAR